MRSPYLASVVLAACGGAASPSSPTGPDPGAGRLAAPPPADPSQLCDVFTTITLDVVYDGDCPGPSSISIDYNPTAPNRVDLTEGTFDPATVILDVQRFDAQGCAGEVVYELGEGNLELTFYATGPDEVAGTGTWRDEGGSECPARITGHWKAWSE